jgi:hypothetical protein
VARQTSSMWNSESSLSEGEKTRQKKREREILCNFDIVRKETKLVAYRDLYVFQMP